MHVDKFQKSVLLFTAITSALATSQDIKNKVFDKKNKTQLERMIHFKDKKDKYVPSQLND